MKKEKKTNKRKERRKPLIVFLIRVECFFCVLFIHDLMNAIESIDTSFLTLFLLFYNLDFSKKIKVLECAIKVQSIN